MSARHTHSNIPMLPSLETPHYPTPLERATCSFKQSLSCADSNVRVILLSTVVGLLSCALLLAITMV